MAKMRCPSLNGVLILIRMASVCKTREGGLVVLKRFRGVSCKRSHPNRRFVQPKLKLEICSFAERRQLSLNIEEYLLNDQFHGGQNAMFNVRQNSTVSSFQSRGGSQVSEVFGFAASSQTGCVAPNCT
ncbi:hypothetical protein RB10772 [Rhodopirellula baltica SH 1]|uniref:Uncharacterized protein n=1 Tax=Rhodopirellula baltica (strain DSM 10527 / NCIMB 13988 / SH1) TaxID=243090 RepID=Q7UK95_RHOBA|nr:hypothetical protein RB10772 [Rhodopirellula baltica SH 1]